MNGTWTDGAIGSVLASVGDEQGRFYVPDTEDRLFFHRTLLDTHETSRGDDVTDGYNTDWYIKGFRKMPTDDHGNYTHTVQGIMGADGINYHIWRTEQDTLFRRMGDLRKGEPGQEGIWARVKGTSIRRNGQFPFEDRYKTYEVGYDQLAGHSDTQDRESALAIRKARRLILAAAAIRTVTLWDGMIRGSAKTEPISIWPCVCTG